MVWLSAPSEVLHTSITTRLVGANVMISTPLTDGSVYAQDVDGSWPVRDVKQQGPLYVVSAVSSSDGIGGSRATNYFYRGAKAHLKGGGFLGFRQIEATDTGTGVVTVASF